MKLRKLILNAKLKKIEKQNQNILVFHCNLTANEWRQLKNLLCNKNFDESQKSTLENTKKHFSYKVLFLSKSSSECIEGVSSSGDLKEKQGVCDLQPRATRTMTSAKQLSQTQMKLAGCLLFFHSTPNDLFEDFPESRFKPSELLKKLESSDFNNNLLLLYGQMNHIPLNHLDLKIALQLDPQETRQQLLISIQQLSMSLNSLLYQSINDFIQIQQQFFSNSR